MKRGRWKCGSGKGGTK